MLHKFIYGRSEAGCVCLSESPKIHFNPLRDEGNANNMSQRYAAVILQSAARLILASLKLAPTNCRWRNYVLH